MCRLTSASFLIGIVGSISDSAQTFVSELCHAMGGGFANITHSAHRTATPYPHMLQASHPSTRPDEAGQLRRGYSILHLLRVSTRRPPTRGRGRAVRLPFPHFSISYPNSDTIEDGDTIRTWRFGSHRLLSKTHQCSLSGCEDPLSSSTHGHSADIKRRMTLWSTFRCSRTLGQLSSSLRRAQPPMAQSDRALSIEYLWWASYAINRLHLFRGLIHCRLCYRLPTLTSTNHKCAMRESKLISRSSHR